MLQTTQTTTQSPAQMTRRQYQHLVFSVYNKALKAAKAGFMDTGRLNKALGIVQSKRYETSCGEEYITDLRTCTCKDFEYRNTYKRKDSHGNRYLGPCKHQIALMIEIRVNEMIEEQALSALFGQSVKVG